MIASQRKRRSTVKVLPNDVFFAAPKTELEPRKRLTATEEIGGVKCVITLEKGRDGRYREIKLTPADSMILVSG